jgi:lipid-binding SYLF domain-containing protein
MRKRLTLLLCAATVLSGTAALAESESETIARFKQAGQSASFFQKSYGYAVFPTIGKGGIGVGGGHGGGRVYEHGKPIGHTSVTQVSFGAQLGGEAYSEIIFFQDRRALERFTSGKFEFGAGAQAVVITAGASAGAGTEGAHAGASADAKHAATAGAYHDGMAVFTIVKGGAMYELSVQGQKFSYKSGTAE